LIHDGAGTMVAPSPPDDDPVVKSALAGVTQHGGLARMSAAATEFQFDHVTERPPSRQTWLAYATTYRDEAAGRHWILITAMPEAFYLAGLRVGHSPAAGGDSLSPALPPGRVG